MIDVVNDAHATPLPTTLLERTLSARRFLCCIPNMRAGGAERVLANLMNEMASREAIVCLATLEEASAESFYPLDPRIEQIRLGHAAPGRFGRIASLPAMIASLRETIVSRAPEAVISFLDVMNFPVLLAARNMGVPVLVSERVDPVHLRFARPRNWIRNHLYREAAAVVVQTTRVRDRFPRALRERISVIPNAISPAPLRARPDVAGDDGRWRILGVGRLDPQKGFDLLLEAFARIATDRPDWEIVIHADTGSPEHERLQGQAARLGLAGRVVFAGLSSRVADELVRGHIMAFPSRFEGFPNALGEAVAHALPVVAFKGVSGVEELVHDGRNGLLVDRGPGEVADLARTLAALMDDPALRVQLGSAGPAVTKGFAPECVFGQWVDTLAGVLPPRSTPGGRETPAV